MTTNRIAELLAPFLHGVSLSESQLGSIATYIEILTRWNQRINLTTVRDHDEIVTRHFGESLFAAKELFPIPAVNQSAIDVGSGAGFPGLPLKIWNPALSLTLIESNQKKAAFLREVVRNLGISGTRVFAGRAETIREQASLVILRAVERFERILSVANRLVETKGRIALLIGDAQIEAAKSVLGEVEWQDPLPLPLSQSRSLLVGHSAVLRPMFHGEH